MFTSVVSIGERILLTLWVGGMWAIGYLAAPTLFAVLEDRSLAGTLAGKMFTGMSVIGLLCGSLLLAGLLLRNGGRAWRQWRVWVVLVMLAVVVTGQFVLQPAMAELRAAGLSGENAARFGMLHGVSSTLFLLNSLLGLALVAFGLQGAARDAPRINAAG